MMNVWRKNFYCIILHVSGYLCLLLEGIGAREQAQLWANTSLEFVVLFDYTQTS
jgi:hypothetical protein